MKQLLSGLGLAAALWSAPWAAAQDESPVLAGPKVAAPRAPDRPSLLERGVDGLVKPADPTAEQAAAALLTLDDSTKEAVDAAFGRRAKALDDFVLGNLDLLVKFGAAEGGGNKKDQLLLAYEVYRKLEHLWKDGPLEKQVKALLPEGQAAEYDRLLREYWKAYVADRRKIVKPDGKHPNIVEVLAEAKMQSLGREIERSFQRVNESGELVYKYFTKGIIFHDDQQAKVRTLIMDHWQKTKGEASEEQNRLLFVKVIQLLDAKQRRQLMKNLQGKK